MAFLSGSRDFNPEADEWTQRRIAAAEESGQAADEAHALAEQIRNGGRS